MNHPILPIAGMFFYISLYHTGNQSVSINLYLHKRLFVHLNLIKMSGDSPTPTTILYNSTLS